tara:strand:+ start:89 stop:376 length:288 start_codon:yes stop_codon:yes gene_type:complete
MPNYEITEHSYRKAKELNVDLLPAENKHKKIGIWKNDKWLCDVGAKNYLDFPTLLKMEEDGELPSGHAHNKRRQYKIRHKYDRGETSFWTNKILW